MVSFGKQLERGRSTIGDCTRRQGSEFNRPQREHRRLLRSGSRQCKGPDPRRAQQLRPELEQKLYIVSTFALILIHQIDIIFRPCKQVDK